MESTKEVLEGGRVMSVDKLLPALDSPRSAAARTAASEEAAVPVAAILAVEV